MSDYQWDFGVIFRYLNMWFTGFLVTAGYALATTLGLAWLAVGLVYGVVLTQRRRAELEI